MEARLPCLSVVVNPKLNMTVNNSLIVTNPGTLTPLVAAAAAGQTDACHLHGGFRSQGGGERAV